VLSMTKEPPSVKSHQTILFSALKPAGCAFDVASAWLNFSHMHEHEQSKSQSHYTSQHNFHLRWTLPQVITGELSAPNAPNVCT
jgi:hypothetical protein